MKKFIITVVTVALILGASGIVYAQEGDGVMERIANTLERIEEAISGQAELGSRLSPNTIPLLTVGNDSAATTSDAAAKARNVSEFRHIIVQVQSYETPSMTIKFKGSIADVVGNFDNTTNTAPTTTDSDFIEIVDLENGARYDGDTGITITTSETRLFEINTNGLNWLYATTTSYTSGSTTVWIKPFTNQ